MLVPDDPVFDNSAGVSLLKESDTGTLTVAVAEVNVVVAEEFVTDRTLAASLVTVKVVESPLTTCTVVVSADTAYVSSDNSIAIH